MAKKFNTTGACIPAKHYMVDLTSRLEAIKEMIDEGDYFMINRAGQYGKTTILRALADFLKDDYVAVSMDFQRLDSTAYEGCALFLKSFSSALLRTVRRFPDGIREQFEAIIQGTERMLSSGLCKLLDEEIAGTDEFSDRGAAWTEEGVNEVVKLLLTEQRFSSWVLKKRTSLY